MKATLAIAATMLSPVLAIAGDAYRVKVTSELPARISLLHWDSNENKMVSAKELGSAPLTVELPRTEYGLVTGWDIGFTFENDPTEYRVSLIELVSYHSESDILSLTLAVPDYGKQPAFDEATATILKYLKNSLFDPDSAKLKWGSFGKVYQIEGNKIVYQWTLEFSLNSKNRMGGYAGWKNCTAFFTKGKLGAVDIP